MRHEAEDDNEPLRLVCSELFGGNREVHTPVHMPDITGIIYSRPCEGGRGGDVHYLSVCGSGLLSRMCLADVAGHGEPVAAVSTELHTLLRRYMNQPDQRHVLRTLNDHLERQGIQSMTTAATVSYYPPKRALSYSYAGHPPGWLYRKDTSRWQRLVLPESDSEAAEALQDVPLAVMPGARFSRAQIRNVGSGDRLLLITDGILEAPDAARRHLGAEEVERCLQMHHKEPVATLSERLLELVERHTQGAGLVHDDVSFMLMQFDPLAWKPAIWSAVKNRVTRPRGNSTKRQLQTASR